MKLSKRVNFCHIYPTALLERAKQQKVHLVLAHLVETDELYRQFYADLPKDHKIILDNSAFEMYKQNREMYPSDKLIEMGEMVNADVLVMSDYPGEHVDKTIKAAELLIPEFKRAGFGTFFVPQSEVGKSDQFYAGFEYALDVGVDLIGVSILGCPNAYGVERNNKLQRFLSRRLVFNELSNKGMLTKPDQFHCLGLTDGPKEIGLLKDFHEFIFSWDSSSAPWAAVNGIKYDSTPTGLVDGKFELEVDFNWVGEFSEDLLNYNVGVIDKMCQTC